MFKTYGPNGFVCGNRERIKRTITCVWKWPHPTCLTYIGKKAGTLYRQASTRQRSSKVTATVTGNVTAAVIVAVMSLLLSHITSLPVSILSNCSQMSLSPPKSSGQNSHRRHTRSHCQGQSFLLFHIHLYPPIPLPPTSNWWQTSLSPPKPSGQNPGHIIKVKVSCSSVFI